MSEFGPERKATILVVDDTPDNLALMNGLLKQDYRVKIANAGEIALEIAIADPMPDLILLDVMMPGIDGYEVCRRLKREAKTANIPVIFLTARTEIEDEEKGLELGAVDYITKPVSPPILLARVKSQLAIKAMADILQAKNAELESARQIADKANLAKSAFLSSMSHELRSPLNAILGFGQLLETDLPPPSAIQMESITQILQAGWHLLALIDEILDLAKVESGQVPMATEAVPVAEVLAECRQMIDPQAKLHEVGMIVPALACPVHVLADRRRMKQVLLNLLSNAAKYNRRQGTVEVKCLSIAPDRLRISVTDTGPGLSSGQLAQLFQPFNRLGQETGPEEGTGIGLVVAKRLVELMGGEIGVESVVGTGSVFWFELQTVADPAAAEEVRVVPCAPPAHVQNTQGRRTVLYVEDNPANLKLVETIIARHPDLRLISAVNGTLGIDLAKSARPDVILMDISLPGISGVEVMKILQADARTAQIPVIAVSANAMPLDIQRGLDAGFLRYLTKPINIDEFMHALDSALRLPRERGDAAAIDQATG